MSELIWNGWVQDWEWMLAAMERKGATIWCDLEIAPPASEDQVRELRQQRGIMLPEEFVEVLTGYSAAVRFQWSLDELDDPPGIYRPCTRGGHWELWSMDALLRLSQDQAGALKRLEEIEAEAINSGLIDPNALSEPVWHNKTFFIHVPNGDYIAFDVSHGITNCPVVYLDHEWGSFNGARLGLNFVDFMTRWSNLGCPGVESWKMKPFYDPAQNLLMSSGEVVENWKRWVNQ
jgi:hypothetical protein